MALTKGCITAFENGDIAGSPYVQIVDIKRLANSQGNGPGERFRLVISDGENVMQAMLATQLNLMIEDGTVRCHS